MAWTILSLVLSLSLTGGLIIILIFFASLIFGKKVSFKWRYYIWIIAIARLLLPFSPEKNLMEYIAKHMHSIVQTTVNNSDNISISKILSVQKKSDNFTLLKNTETNIIIQKSNILKIIWNIKGYLCIFWIMIALLCFLYKVTVYRNFVKFVKAGSTPVDNINQLEALSATESQLNIHIAIDLWTNPIIASPMLIGFFHPCIILPNASLSEQEFYYTILHELIHYKRKDMFYKWIIQIVICIHWFNPLVYAAGKSINRLCELSCDEAVITRLKSVKERKEYAKTLLDAMTAQGIYKENIATLTLSENKKLLKERLEAIMTNNKKTTVSKLLISILTVLITFTGIFTGSYTVGASNNLYNELKSQTETTIQQKKGSNANSKSDTITSSQADKMALALTDRIWVWDWIEFFVPYMSEKGVKKIIPASRNSQWAGSVDMTTGKKIKFTKKQINAARKHKPSHPLTCADIDDHALMIMQSNGDWECASYMLPYMSHKGIRAVVRCYNSKHGGSGN